MECIVYTQRIVKLVNVVQNDSEHKLLVITLVYKNSAEIYVFDYHRIVFPQ